jgi:hypothetical protein
MRHLVTLLFAGCAGLACGRVCTQALCHDTLLLEVRSPDGGVVEPFRGEVTIDGEALRFECPAPPSAEQECVDAGLISLNLSWLGRTGTSRSIGQPVNALPVRVTAEDGGLSWSRTITSPRTWFINGPECGPQCIRHVERVELQGR